MSNTTSKRKKPTKATCTSTMTPEAIEARRRYKAEWSARNRDKLKEYNRTYWERQAARYRAEQEKEREQGQDITPST